MSTVGDGDYSFGVVDYIIFVLMILTSLVIGIWSTTKSKDTTEDYLMGNRSFGPFGVAMSLITSLISSIGLLGLSGEVYGHGSQIVTYGVGLCVGCILVGSIIISVIYPLHITSVTEYFELRFHSVVLRKSISFIWVFQILLYLGICLYTPTLAMAIVMPMENMYHVYILATVGTIYSTVGGIRAVVWTDVFQMTVVYIGMIGTLILACIEVGGFQVAMRKAYEGSRIEFFNFSTSLTERHTFLNTFFSGIFFMLLYGSNQINVQRLCSVRSLKDAKMALYLNAIGYVILFFFIFTAALSAFAFYADCDPFLRGEITKQEQIIPFFIADRGKYIVGFSGLFIATLIGSTLSTVSSVLSAMVSVTYEDIKKLPCLSNLSEHQETLVNKGLTVLFGCLGVAVSVMTANISSLVEAANTVRFVSMGPVLGVFFLGISYPKCSVKPACIGLLVSLVFLCWISIGAIYYVPPEIFRPLSLRNCSFDIHQAPEIVNGGTANSSLVSNISTQHQRNKTVRFQSYEEYELWHNMTYNIENEPFLMPFYKVSYTLYPIIGSLLTFIVGIIATFFLGGNDIEDVSPRLIIPFLRRFYWPERNVKEMNQDLREENEEDNEERRSATHVVVKRNKEEDNEEKEEDNEERRSAIVVKRNKGGRFWNRNNRNHQNTEDPRASVELISRHIIVIK